MSVWSSGFWVLGVGFEVLNFRRFSFRLAFPALGVCIVAMGSSITLDLQPWNPEPLNPKSRKTLNHQGYPAQRVSSTWEFIFRAFRF